MSDLIERLRERVASPFERPAVDQALMSEAATALSEAKAENERLREEAISLAVMFYWPDAKRRLWYISERIAKGTLNRDDICKAFGVSVPQASADIGAWMKLHPGAAFYDAKAKCYKPSIVPQ